MLVARREFAVPTRPGVYVVEQKPPIACPFDVDVHWETAHLSAPSVPDSIGTLRRQIMNFVSAAPLSASELTDLEVAIGEACTNALRHGSPRGEYDKIRVKCMRNESALVVEITDSGNGFNPGSVKAPAAAHLPEGGMGIYLMRRLVDHVEFEFKTGTTVRLLKYYNKN